MANEMTVPTLTHCEVNKPEIIQEIAVEETEDTIEILCSNTNSKKDRGFLIVYEMFSSYHMIRGGNTTSVGWFQILFQEKVKSQRIGNRTLNSESA